MGTNTTEKTPVSTPMLMHESTQGVEAGISCHLGFYFEEGRREVERDEERG